MSIGADPQDVTFSDVDAADRWLNNLHRTMEYSLATHGNRFVSKDDIAAWSTFIAKWNPFRNSLGNLSILWMSRENKQTFHKLLAEGHAWQERFAGKGMAIIPVPYALEIVTLLRTMPKQLTAGQMVPKLAAVVQCGDKLLDAHAPWYGWRKSGDAKGLAAAVDSAKAMGIILSRSKDSNLRYFPGDPIYDEFLRRLTKIWIEAAGLYGITETERSNLAALKSDLKKGAQDTSSNIGWLLLAGGVGYLGLKWMVSRPGTVTVAVPDAIQEDSSSHHLEG